MLLPYINASRTNINNIVLSYVELGHWSLKGACCQPWVKGFLRYMPSPFYSASVVLFQLYGGMVSHMQALATPSSTVHNTWILNTESISVLAACSSGSDVGM